MKRNCPKTWKSQQMFSPSLSEIFPLFFTSLQMHGNSKNEQFLAVKTKTWCNWSGALMQLEWCLFPNLYLTLQWKIVLLELYKIWVFVASQFEILKSTENINSRGLEWVRNENVFSQTNFNKILNTYSRYLVKQLFPRNVFQLIFDDVQAHMSKLDI